MRRLRALVRVRRQVEIVVNDAVVFGREVHPHGFQPVLAVVGVTGERLRASVGDHADGAEIGTRVVEMHRLVCRARHDDAREQLEIVSVFVEVVERVAVGVARDLEAMHAIHQRVLLLETRAAIRPEPARGAGVPGQEVVRSVPVVALVARARGVPVVEDLAPVTEDLGDSAAGGADRTSQLVDALLRAEAPLVVVVFVDEALRVVGPYRGEIEAQRRQRFVDRLDDEVAIRGVDVDAVPSSTHQGIAADASSAQCGCRRVEETETGSRDDCDHDGSPPDGIPLAARPRDTSVESSSCLDPPSQAEPSQTDIRGKRRQFRAGWTRGAAARPAAAAQPAADPGPERC